MTLPFLYKQKFPLCLLTSLLNITVRKNESKPTGLETEILENIGFKIHE